MKHKPAGQGRRRRGSTRFFLSAVAIAILIFVVVKLLQGWQPWHGVNTAKQKAPASVTALLPQPSGDSLAGFELVLRRGGCTSGCPYYALSAKRDTLEYLGVRGVKKRGDVREPLDMQRKRALLGLVREASFFSFSDSYGLSDAGCKLKRADAPTLTVGVTLNGETKIVQANEGCSNVPKRLLALANGIDRVSGSAQWTGIVNASASASATAH